jgi:hypothetical protein
MSINFKLFVQRRWPILFITAVAFFFFWQYFLLDQTLYAGDTAFVMMPFRQFATSSLLRGQIPLWNPYIFGGTPALAEAQYQVFYPPNLLLFLLGVPWGMGILLPFHLALMAIGTYLFGRQMQFNRLAATVFAVTFSFGACVQSRLGVPVYTEAAAWMPWILWAYVRGCERGSYNIFLPGVFLAVQLATGAPQFTFYTLCLLTAYHILRIGSKAEPRTSASEIAIPEITTPQTAISANSSRMRPWLVLGLTVAFGGLLSAAQTLPELELAGLSDRGTKASYEYATQFSLAPHHFWTTLLLPGYYGLFQSATTDNFFPGEESGYLGIVALGLIGAAFAVRSRHALFWTVIAVVSLGLALGSNNPLYRFLYDWVPGIGVFRAPARWLLITSFAGAALAGMGTQWLSSDEALRKRAARFACVTLAICLVACIFLILRRSEPPTAPGGGWGQAVLMCVALVIVGLTGFAKIQPSLRRRLLLALPILLAGDLFVVSQGMEVQSTLAAAAFETPPGSASHLKSTAPHERFWTHDQALPLEKWQTASAPLDMSPVAFRANNVSLMRELMPSCVPTEFEVRSLTGAWGALMPLRRHAVPLYKNDTPLDVKLKWLRLMNVRHHLAYNALSIEGLVPVGGETVKIYRDDQALPRAFVVPYAQWTADRNPVDILSSPKFNPQIWALIDGQPPKVPEPGWTIENLFAPATITKDELHFVSAEVQSFRGRHFVLMDTAYPGWHARVNGQSAEVRTANWMGRSVEVPAGAARIELHYEPQSVRLGLFISLIAVSIFSAALAADVMARRTRPRRGKTGRIE